MAPSSQAAICVPGQRLTLGSPCTRRDPSRVWGSCGHPRDHATPRGLGQVADDPLRDLCHEHGLMTPDHCINGAGSQADRARLRLTGLTVRSSAGCHCPIYA